ncbi:NADH-quinone oxidoreductase subunit 15 [Marinithermus hydrothermalis]|uniref:NADH dehydrogenase (Quinone) n=1 Tax=Marinithermus hydrothermalis (strain DSM 14884 / JCM 11576 / T1) TaxID=869210 RepID=F2NM44_MARHT|nr:NADH-quinone oxidoreductase subunit 15 [Marinithermus hydrothermalis]AEB11514.1 NADH dehydrogenase (quinone) [Marinithermus hydrothermalis DSM 14884]
MSENHDKALYEAWVEVLDWLKAYAVERGVRFEWEADFPDYIYRMHRPYDLPTRVMTVSLSDERGEPFFLADVSPRHAKLKQISFRVPGGHLHWHAHYEEGRGLVLGGKIPLTKEKLYQLADRARHHVDERRVERVS